MARRFLIVVVCAAGFSRAVREQPEALVDLAEEVVIAQDAKRPRWLGGAPCEDLVPNAMPSRLNWVRIRRCKCPKDHALVGDSAACGDGTRTLFKASTVDSQGCSCEPLKSCPVVKTQPDFNFTEYVSKRWYVQEQMPITYLPDDANNCVTANYKLKEDKDFWGYSITVENRAKYDDGRPRGIDLCAYSADRNDPAKLKVSLCLLPRFLAGPYWVLAHNEEEGYAIISGGQPTIKTPYGCRTGKGTNNSGLWIITREINPSSEVVEKARAIAEQQGFDVGVLKPVSHSDCEGVAGY